MKTVFKVQEVADQLRLSKTQIYRLLESGQLSHYRLGGRIVVSEQHLEEYLSSREVAASS